MNKNKMEAPFNENEYDSINYFRDVDWITLKGINEIEKNELSYPYVAFAYKKEGIDIVVSYDETKIVKRVCNKYKTIRYIKLKHYDKQYRDTIYVYFLYRDTNDALVQLNCFSDNIFEDGKAEAKMILRAEQLDSMSISQSYYFANNEARSVSLNDILDFNKPALKSRFDILDSSILRIRDGKLYSSTLFREDYLKNSKYSGSEEDVLVPTFDYSSFFYHYIDLYKKWESVNDEKES